MADETKPSADAAKAKVDDAAKVEAAKAEAVKAKEAEAAKAKEDDKPTETVVQADTDAVKAQHEAVDKAMEDLNARNEAGHQKNMEAIEAAAEEAKAHTEKPDASHVPTGKEWNRNTPVVHEDGSKSWV
jgi:hypothetical protein